MADMTNHDEVKKKKKREKKPPTAAATDFSHFKGKKRVILVLKCLTSRGKKAS